MAAVTRIPTEVWCIIFRQLSLRDLLPCACVCKTWTSICNRDEFWIEALAKRIGSAEEPATISLVRFSLGELNYKALYQFASVGSGNCESSFRLEWFKEFPYHPIRHRAPTPLNLLRLINCMMTNTDGFLNLAGQTPRVMSYEDSGWDWHSEDCLQHRLARYGSLLDTSVRIVYWACFGALVAVTAASLSPFIEKITMLVFFRPFKLLYVGGRAIPAALLLGWSSLLFSNKKEIFYTVCFLIFIAVILVQTYPEWLTEYPIPRLIFFLVCVAFGESRKAGRVPAGRPGHYRTRTHGLTGLIIGGTVVLWRLVVPMLITGGSFLGTVSFASHLANLAFSPWCRKTPARRERTKRSVELVWSQHQDPLQDIAVNVDWHSPN